MRRIKMAEPSAKNRKLARNSVHVALEASERAICANMHDPKTHQSVNGMALDRRSMRSVGRGRRAVRTRLIPAQLSPDAPPHYPLGAYPFLYRLPDGTGYVTIYVDYRLDDPRLDSLGGVYTDDDLYALSDNGPRIVELPRSVGAKLIVRCGPGWLVFTLPFAGVKWTRNGRLLGVKVDSGDQFKSWITRIEKQSNEKAAGARHAGKRQ